MGWKLDNQQLYYEDKGMIFSPSAEDIFSLISGGKKIKKLTDEIYSPERDLDIHFSRLGAKFIIEIEFEQETQEIFIIVKAQKGKKKFEINYTNNILPDSVVVERVWYNLLADYEETFSLLQQAEISCNGRIFLHQYIRLIRYAGKCENIEIIDKAECRLSNHPFKDICTEVSTALRANLYSYQIQGYRWMRFMLDEQCGCILGDEMGLGKTLQIIALIAEIKQNRHMPVLIIVPVSLLENWKREFDKFTTGVNVCVHHGPKRTGLYTDLLVYDVVIISYNTACSDQALLRMIKWELLVVDEAQNIKNPNAIRTKLIKNIPRKAAIAVTGTPFENHIMDLWSLMDFIAPGCFGKLSEFRHYYSDDVIGSKMLEPLLSPIMIRRRVAEVAQDLPQRIDVPQALRLLPNEAVLYEAEREKILKDFDGKNATLPMIQKLRMYCTHPGLLKAEKVKNPVIDSSKYERLCELIAEISLLKEKIILFTSYNKMFEILKEDITKRFNIQVMVINGQTPPGKRQSIIDEFSSSDGCALLALNPRAAGAGLNITSASRVIHYNLEWNPALEDQASARSYRRGQTKNVFVYRLFYVGTVEEIVNDRIEKKRKMFDAAVVGVDGSNNNSEDIIRALMISPGGTKDGK